MSEILKIEILDNFKSFENSYSNKFLLYTAQNAIKF